MISLVALEKRSNLWQFEVGYQEAMTM